MAYQPSLRLQQLREVTDDDVSAMLEQLAPGVSPVDPNHEGEATRVARLDPGERVLDDGRLSRFDL